MTEEAGLGVWRMVERVGSGTVIVILNAAASILGLLGGTMVISSLARTTRCLDQLTWPVSIWGAMPLLSVACTAVSVALALRYRFVRPAFLLSAFSLGGMAFILAVLACLAWALPSGGDAPANCEPAFVVRFLGHTPALAPLLFLLGSAWALSPNAVPVARRLALSSGASLLLAVEGWLLMQAFSDPLSSAT